ncbi:hypothetical protein [Photobacterium nomapromontoriensis]|uniref:hypothetical protein n=1 Tax=Photobacterium nomapromontoriensis TaxID=2910237 RepID=UPI003D12A3B7
MTKFTFLPLSLLVISNSVFSAINVTDNFSLRGFGSTSITQSNNAVPIFVHREITDDTCYDCDTTFGIQADLQITDNINASVQVVKRPQDTWSDPELEWAYINGEYKDISLKGGRLRIPLFLMSEYYYVGQAYPWARPPQEVYDSILGFTYFDGISAAWHTELNDENIFTLSPYYGFSHDYKAKLGNEKLLFDTDHFAGLSAELSGFNYRVHFGYLHSQYTMLPASSPIKETLNIYTLGAEYSLNNWQFITEAQIDKLQSSWYFSSAYNFGEFTPYAVYGESHHRRKTQSVTAGLRYDITHTISLNAEWQGIYMQRSDYDQFNTGQFITSPKLTDESKDAQIYTLMINFVF